MAPPPTIQLAQWHFWLQWRQTADAIAMISLVASTGPQAVVPLVASVRQLGQCHLYLHCRGTDAALAIVSLAASASRRKLPETSPQRLGARRRRQDLQAGASSLPALSLVTSALRAESPAAPMLPALMPSEAAAVM